jgi:SHS2 domain-containing protein
MKMKSYDYLEDMAIADIAFLARGKDLPETFEAASDALTNVMVEDLDTIRPLENRAISLQNDDLEMLLFDFLQELIYYKDTDGLALRVPAIEVKRFGAEHHLDAVARGERIDPERHHTRADVKAVTLHHFSLQKIPSGWQARVILDI